MFVKPRLKQSFRTETVESKVLFVLSEHKQYVLEGEVVAALARLLDGERTLTQICREMEEKASFAEVLAALAQLQQIGCVVEADGAAVHEHAAFWDYLGGELRHVDVRLQATSVSVAAIGAVDGAGLADALIAIGLSVQRRDAAASSAIDADGSLLVVATDDYLNAELQAINAQALHSGSRWLLVKPVGMTVWVGPLFQPGETGCWDCLRQRLEVNRQTEYFIRSRGNIDMPVNTARVRLPSIERLAASFAATEIARAAVLDDTSLAGKIRTLDLALMRSGEHVLVRRPQCASCGTPIADEPAPLVLASRPKSQGADGEHRALSTAETYERQKAHVSPITGVVTSLTMREPDAYGLSHNYVAGHYFPIVMSNDLRILQTNQVSRSGGNGATDLQAKVSAICEALERYSGIAWGSEHKVVASYAELAPDAYHVRELSLFSDEQYRRRPDFRAGGANPFHDAPPPLPDDREIAWTPAWSLVDQCFRYLPTAYCFYGHVDGDNFHVATDSNGNAAGNTLEEAILQGFLEVVERDSVALWWYNRVTRPRVAAETFDLPYWEETERHHRSDLGREIHVLDLTADLGIPAMAAVSRKTDGPSEDIIVGYGAHLDARAALRRALEEANQYLPALRDAADDGSTIYRSFNEEVIKWWKTATFDNQPYLACGDGLPARRFADFERLAADDLRDDVDTCVGRAAARHLDVLVVDQTRPDIGLSVVKVVVPGMRHFWRRLSPGRLYDVPVELGWIPERTAEENMNPFSVST